MQRAAIRDRVGVRRDDVDVDVQLGEGADQLAALVHVARGAGDDHDSVHVGV